MIKDVNGLIEHLKQEIRNRTDIAVIGLSGGADSTLVAILSTLALGKENVVGVHMPYNHIDTGGEKFNARSMKFARKLGIREEHIAINQIADTIIFSIIKSNGDWAKRKREDISDLDHGNARARARMCVLYGLTGVLSHTTDKNKRIRVVGTGNLSEDAIGYDTKGGDALTDFHPIGRLFKSEVYALLDHFKNIGVIDEAHIDRVPSAGLWEGQTDEGELGHTYNEMEPVIRKMWKADRSEIGAFDSNTMTELGAFVYERHMANKHKHDAIPSIDVSKYVD